MVVVVTLKSKIAASTLVVGNSKSTYYFTYLKAQRNPRAATKRPSHIRTHVSISAI